MNFISNYLENIKQKLKTQKYTVFFSLLLLAGFIRFGRHIWLKFFNLKVKEGKQPKLVRPRIKRKCTISLNKVILWNPSPDPKVPNFAFVESVVPALTQLCERYDVYFIALVNSQIEQDQILNLLNHSELVLKHQLDTRKILFCNSVEGKSHIVRHLEPYIHVDNEIDVIYKLKSYIHKLYLILTNHSTPIQSEFNQFKNIEISKSFLESSLYQH
ncbi:hypothetical protein CONCODRAFT_9211 [Conidiobolus coronatus NRRL 28638]|uniref:Peroxisome assembly protein 22 n=1 Tax=Conidiobolus coronatus (strain ATCC 28846 / CBS 209.66 / NRRL 28638) TaxID=796925 RepID=A0A137P0P1_CONC2|nr:hypothetical protein CONCODRAFT_9211 [Conidiobolus coronatus NRRL 28638]|eukprot:KXN68538.1 hypothetical protein CONCODRAFT_9211 [Conidiobolus coronatus NRRL 28638]